jgi:hypothetical protein
MSKAMTRSLPLRRLIPLGGRRENGKRVVRIQRTKTASVASERVLDKRIATSTHGL